jgi:hypothetical protein
MGHLAAAHGLTASVAGARGGHDIRLLGFLFNTVDCWYLLPCQLAGDVSRRVAAVRVRFEDVTLAAGPGMLQLHNIPGTQPPPVPALLAPAHAVLAAAAGHVRRW